MAGANFVDVAVGVEGSLIATKKNGNLVKAHHHKWIQVYDSANKASNYGKSTAAAVGAGGQIFRVNEKNAVFWPRDICEFTPLGENETKTWILYFPKHKKMWHDARHHCRKAGGDLASAVTPLQIAIMGLRLRQKKNLKVWVGHNDLIKHGSWKWSDKKVRNKTKMLKSHWKTGNYNNLRNKDCGTAVSNGGAKMTLPVFSHDFCHKKLNFICKKTKGADTDNHH